MAVPDINPDSITAMSALDDHPVFFLHLNHSATPTVVVKSESTERFNDADASTSIRWSSKLMKNVNHQLAQCKILRPAELEVFRASVAEIFPENSRQANNARRDDKWTKLNFVNGLTTADIYTHNGNFKPANVAKIKRVMSKLLDDQVWEELGKVVAVDIFNGNSDRFDISNGRWMNPGNVMFTNNGHVLGLDTFDPYSHEQSNLAQPGVFEELNILRNEARRLQFASACTRSVGTTMRQELQRESVASVKFGVANLNGGIISMPVDASMDQMYEPWTERFACGIQAGARDLKTYLQRKREQYGQNRNLGFARQLPVGVMKRMEYLGWHWRFAPAQGLNANQFFGAYRHNG